MKALVYLFAFNFVISSSVFADNSPLQATETTLLGKKHGNLGNTDQIDWWKFEVTGTGELTISVPDPANGNVAVYLRDPNNILAQSVGTPVLGTHILTYQKKTTGKKTYYLQFYSTQASSFGYGWTANFAEAPDLVTQVSVSPSTVKWGDGISPTITVEREGGELEGASTVSLYLSPTNNSTDSNAIRILNQTITESSFDSSGEWQSSLSYGLPSNPPSGFSSSGTIYLLGIVTKGANEFNENNNIDDKALTIPAPTGTKPILSFTQNTLNLITKGRLASDPIEIFVSSHSSTDQTVTLLYREAGTTGSYNQKAFTGGDASVFAATLPAWNKPLEILIKAQNTVGVSQLGPLTIPIKGDDSPPKIIVNFDSLQNAQAGSDVLVRAQITDDVSVSGANLQVKTSSTTGVIPLIPQSSGDYVATIPASLTASGQGLGFHIEATDSAGNLGRFPLSGVHNIFEPQPREDLGLQNDAAREADPVDLATLSYIAQFQLDQDYRGFSLKHLFSMSYDSLTAPHFNKGIGYGWTHNYNICVIDESATLKVLWGDGRLTYFTAHADGSITSITPGSFDKLERIGNGGYQVTTHQMLVYSFDSEGKLVSISDRAQNTLTLTRSQSSSSDILEISLSDVGIVARLESEGGKLVRYKRQHPTQDSLELFLTFSYDSNGDLSQIASPYQTEPIYRFTYDQKHRITKILEAEGNTLLSNKYDSSGKISEQRDGLNRLWRFYGDTPSIGKTTVIDPDGVTSIATHDGKRRLFCFEVTGGERTDLLRNSEDQVTSIGNTQGNLITSQFDGSNISKITNTEGLSVEITHNENNDPTSFSLRSASGAEIGNSDVIYTDQGLPSVITDLTGISRKYIWNKGAIAEIRDHEDQLISKDTFNLNGTVSKKTFGNGGDIIYSHDKRGRVIGVNAFDRGNQLITYDVFDRIVTAANSLNQETQYEFDKNGRLRLIDPHGQEQTSYEYDARNKVIKVTHANGNYVTLEYTNAGRVSRRSWFLTSDAVTPEHVMAYSYDSAGRVSERGPPNLAGTKYRYNAQSILAEVETPRGNTWKMSRTGMGRIHQITTPESKPHIAYSYHLNGQVEEELAANTRRTRYVRDVAGRVRELRRNDNLVASYLYDANGYFSGVKTASNQIIYQTIRDSLGNPLNRSYSHGASQSWVWQNGSELVSSKDERDNEIRVTERDKLGRVLRSTTPIGDETITYTDEGYVETISNSTGIIAYGYDSRGRVISRQGVYGLVQYEWDSINRLKKIIYPDGRWVSYQYNARGHLSGAVDSDEKSYSIESDADGNIISIGYPNGVNSNFNFNPVGRITSYNHSLTGSSEPYQQELFTYNDYHELTNITSTGIPDVKTEIAELFTNDEFQRLVKIEDTPVLYDKSGNIIQMTLLGESVQLTYDYRNLLTSITGSSIQATFFYDAEGLRIKSIINGSERRYVWSTVGSLPMVLEEWDSANQPVLSMSFIGSKMIEQRFGSSLFYCHSNHIDNLVSVTDSNGLISFRAGYGIGGRGVHLVEGDGVAIPSKPYLYNGAVGVRDDGLGLLYMRKRYYRPRTQRFISPDPVLPGIGDLVALNRYQFANGNPMQFNDPTGEYLDTVVDIAFIAYDVYSIGRAVSKGDWNSVGWESLALGADVFGAVVPGGTGFGVGVRALRKGEDVVDAAKDLKKTVAKINPARAKPSLENAPKVPLALPKPLVNAKWGVNRYRHGGEISAIEHINYRHAYNSGFEGVSRFSKETSIKNIKSYVDDALRNGKVTPKGRNGFTIEHNMGRTIGTNPSGDAASHIRVHVNNGQIQTAFPFTP